MSKRKEEKENPFHLYIRKVLKEVNPKARVKKDVIQNLDDIVVRLIKIISVKSVHLVELTRQRTITSRHIQTFFRLFFSGELAKHAVAEGTKAVTKFTMSEYAIKEEKSKRENGEQKSKRITSAAKSGLVFSPARVSPFYRNAAKDYKDNVLIGKGSVYYLTAVLEYIVREILDLSNIIMNNEKGKTITWPTVKKAIIQDGELSHTLTCLDIKI